LNPIKAGIKAMILEKHTNDHIVWAIIKYKNESYCFCSYYFPPSLPITTFITKLTQYINQIKKHFKTVTVNEWQNIWRTTPNASQTKLFFPSISDKLSLKTLRPNNILTQFLSGHGNFGSYLKRFKLSDTDICNCGSAQETPLHVILDCVLFAEEGHQLINTRHRSGDNIHLSPNELMSDKNLFIEFQNFLRISI